MAEIKVIDDENGVEIHSFKTKPEAIGYAKTEFFSPSFEWYKQIVEEGLLDEAREEHELPPSATIQDICDSDFKNFCENSKFTWNDGMYDIFSIELV